MRHHPDSTVRRSLATLVGAAALALAATGCGSDTPAASPATSSTPAAATASSAAPAPSAPSASAGSSAPESSSLGSSSSSTESSASENTGGAGGSAIPVPGDLPVTEIPQMPGATVKVTEQSGAVSFQIKVEGKSGEEIADWYHEAMASAGFQVETQYPNGGFAYRGKGVKGDSASTTSSFILGMSKA